MSCCNKVRSKKYSYCQCLKSLKEINELENKINIELEKAKLLLSLVNCENVDKIKQLLKTNFLEIEKQLFKINNYNDLIVPATII
jgi:hypothetical protein